MGSMIVMHLLPSQTPGGYGHHSRNWQRPPRGLVFCGVQSAQKISIYPIIIVLLIQYPYIALGLFVGFQFNGINDGLCRQDM